jgi:TPR repeat protein
MHRTFVRLIHLALASFIFSGGANWPVHAQAPSTKDFDSRCKAGDAAACFDLGYRYQQGEGVGENPGRALALYQTACTGGVVEGCVNAAFLYELGAKGVKENSSKALVLFRAACDGPDHDVQGRRPHKVGCDGVKRLETSIAASKAAK